MRTYNLKDIYLRLSLIYLLLVSALCYSQDFKILVFHKTNGYRHTGAINASITMLEELGVNTNYDNWTVDNTADSSVFTTENLAQYEVIVFANTSGGGLLNTSEKAAMEAFIQSGKGFVGFHAATDTYRNTDEDSKWLWYNELVGGIVQTSPNHSPNNTSGVMNVLTDHPVTEHIGGVGATWSHDEEWYYWELNGGWLSTSNTPLLDVQATGNNSYDEERPITWLKEYDGGRAFYTALGHNASTYESNSVFREMIQKAVLWVADRLVAKEICSVDAPIGEIIALQKSGGDEQWISIDPTSSALIANVSLTDRALFEVEDHIDGCIALKAIASNKYVQVVGNNTGAPLRATGNAPGTWENFGWTPKGENQVALKSLYNNGWLSADWNENNTPLLSNGATDADFETFNFEIVDNALSYESNSETILFSMYPNPSEGIVTIKSARELENINVIDTQGKIIYTVDAKKQRNMELDLSPLTHGLYFLNIDGYSKSFIKK